MKSIATAVFAALATAIFISAAARQLEAQESMTASFPGKNWAVTVDVPGFSVETEERKPDGREYLLANNSQTGVVLSVTLEQSRNGAHSKTCPDFLRKRVESISQFDVADVKTSEIGPMAVIEYLVREARGIPLQQKNVVACAAKDDIYVDIHLSKVKFQPSDESLFTDILKQVRFAEKLAVSTSSAERTPAAPAASSLEYFRQGSRYYIAHDYGDAILAYQKAVDLEKQRRTLSQNYWRVLVDNLGMSYGITGDLDRSEETLDYGVSKDPGYPMFYYNLGCVYAERNDMGKTMSYLSKAFSLKSNSIPREGMPDPRQDDSFGRFMSNEQFRNFVSSVASGN